MLKPDLDAGASAKTLSKPQRDVELMRLRGEGWTYAMLAHRFGLSSSGVACAIRRYESKQRRENNLGFGARATSTIMGRRNGFSKCAGQLTLAEVAEMSYSDALDTPNLGRVTLREIATVLWRHGIEMRGMPRNLREEIAWSEAIVSNNNGQG
ncbi:MAG: hypothetical protein K2Z25_25805 [Beijerinckiaceae bacterium]|nr:hypothetical protein [Beijerinckiaceae bacterium]